MAEFKAFHVPTEEVEQYGLEDYSSWLERVMPSFVSRFGEDSALSYAEWYYFKKFEQFLDISPTGVQTPGLSSPEIQLQRYS